MDGWYGMGGWDVTVWDVHVQVGRVAEQTASGSSSERVRTVRGGRTGVADCKRFPPWAYFALAWRYRCWLMGC